MVSRLDSRVSPSCSFSGLLRASKNVPGLHAFVGSYNMLGRVLSGAAKLLTPLESLMAGRQFQDTIFWSDELLLCFCSCQEALMSNRSITLPKHDDQLWIAANGSVKMNGLGATFMYFVTRSSTSLVISVPSLKNIKLPGYHVK